MRRAKCVICCSSKHVVDDMYSEKYKCTKCQVSFTIEEAYQ
jgi:hypothetical protein